MARNNVLLRSLALRLYGCEGVAVKAQSQNPLTDHHSVNELACRPYYSRMIFYFPSLEENNVEVIFSTRPTSGTQFSHEFIHLILIAHDSKILFHTTFLGIVQGPQHEDKSTIGWLINAESTLLLTSAPGVGRY